MEIPSFRRASPRDSVAERGGPTQITCRGFVRVRGGGLGRW